MSFLSVSSNNRNYSDVAEIPGLNELWQETTGDPKIRIAILDGAVDNSHPSLSSANLSQINVPVVNNSIEGFAAKHGTHVTSIIFGQHDSEIKGIAPNCTGIVIPVFENGTDGGIAPCSQIDLARAINIAIQNSAQIINISGGEFSPSGTAHPVLSDAVKSCADNGVLIVSAAGNEGCDCLHIPGALPSVLAVGAMNSKSEPLEFSNWGMKYQTQGILALGENILGASPGGGIVVQSGTSYATPIVSGVVALLLSLQLKYGLPPNPVDVRSALLLSAIGCEDQSELDCRKLLGGRLNLKNSISQILKGGDSKVSDLPETQKQQDTILNEKEVMIGSNDQNREDNLGVSESASDESVSSEKSSLLERRVDQTRENSMDINRVKPSTCSCGGETCTCGAAGVGQIQLVFALGTLGYDFGTETRRDSIMQHMNGNPSAADQLLDYLEENPWDAATIIWTLNLDATPIYAVRGQGAFASEIYKRLRQFLNEQITEGVERVSVPGVITGNTRLMNGQVVPTIFPCLRGMYSWTTDALIEAVCGKSPKKDAKDKEKDVYSQKVQVVRNFLERVYFELRNLGTTPQDRAINYAATNAFNVGKVFESALKDEMELDTIEVERSPICRPESECWDVKLTFFNPRKVFEQARKVYRFTVDVSNIDPVMVGSIRSWFVR